MESRRKTEELKKKERLRKQQDLEQLWKHKRQVNNMDTEDGYMVEQLEELMRSLNMIHDLEDACGTFRTWRNQPLPVRGGDETPLSELTTDTGGY